MVWFLMIMLILMILMTMMMTLQMIFDDDDTIDDYDDPNTTDDSNDYDTTNDSDEDDPRELVEKLRKKELIERVICEHDRRQVDIRITNKGLKLLKEADKEMGRFADIISKITDKEAKALSAILEKIRG